MKLTILGSGSCEPSLERSFPANFLKIKNKNILVDCGSGTLHQLLKAKQGYKDIDFVFLTHFHLDHSAEVSSLIQALNWTPKFTRKKELFLIGPVGLKEKFKKGIIRINTHGNYKVKVKEIGKSMNFGDFQAEIQKTIHSAESIAYKFIEKDKSLIITGDCDFDEKLIEFSLGANLLLIECSFPNGMKVKGHLIPRECGEIAKRAKVKKMVLTHLYPSLLPQKNILPEVKKIFSKVVLAEDLKTFNI